MYLTRTQAYKTGHGGLYRVRISPGQAQPAGITRPGGSPRRRLGAQTYVSGNWVGAHDFPPCPSSTQNVRRARTWSPRPGPPSQPAPPCHGYLPPPGVPPGPGKSRQTPPAGLAPPYAAPAVDSDWINAGYTPSATSTVTTTLSRTGMLSHHHDQSVGGWPTWLSQREQGSCITVRTDHRIY